MTKQYQTEGETVAPIMPPKSDQVSNHKVLQLARDVTDLQRELVRTRGDIAKLKNRISELERNQSPRG